MLRRRSHRISLAASVLALASLAFVAATQAKGYWYLPKPPHRDHCKAGYVHRWVDVRWERRHGHLVQHDGKVVWVKQSRCYYAPRLAAPTIRYAAKVDPTFTQSSTNPLAVTYAYSADATLTNGNGTTDLAQAGQLPAGVLNFYSASTPGGPEQLYCSMNVGGVSTGSDCPITYATTGTYQVTTQYIPSAASAVTETDSETVSPYSTTTTLTVTSGACGNGSPPGYNTVAGPYCEYTVANRVTDQNGNAAGPSVWLDFTGNHGEQAPAGHVPANSSCTVYVTASWVLSPDCNFNAGSGVDDAAAWTAAATYLGATGWSQSTSGAQTLTP